MKKVSSPKMRTVFALFFLMVMTSVQLGQPLHHLLVHHRSDVGFVDPHHEVVSGNLHESCPVCDFEFCHFVPQQAVALPQVHRIRLSQCSVQPVDCVIRIASHRFQLRAPPVLSSFS